MDFIGFRLRTSGFSALGYLRLVWGFEFWSLGLGLCCFPGCRRWLGFERML